jgi:hypothetical protein
LSKIKNKSSIDTRLFNIINIELENLCIEWLLLFCWLN